MKRQKSGKGCLKKDYFDRRKHVILLQGKILNVARVSTKYLSLVNLFVRKMRPAFAGKCTAVAVAFAEFAAEPVRVLRHFSFPTKSRGKCSCVFCCHKSCETCTCHCPGFEKITNQSQKEDDFWNRRCHSFFHFASR